MKQQKGSPDGEAGQTLLEILFAFGVATLVMGAIVIGVVTSLNNSQATKNQNLANHYAKEGLEVVRKIRDSSWNDFVSKTASNYCLNQNLVLDAQSTCGQNVGIFVREIKFAHNSAECSNASKVNVKVSWSDNKCEIGTPFCHNIELISCLSNIDRNTSL